MFLKLFKLDRSATAPAKDTPAAEPAPEAAPDTISPPPAAEAPAAASVAGVSGLPAPANDAAADPADAAAVPTAPGDAETVREALASFVTTANLEPLDAPFGQDAALKALRLGAGIKGPGFHVLAIAEAGLEPLAAALHVIEPLARETECAPDWVYVTDFERLTHRRALRLPHGSAERFAATLAEAVAELKLAIQQAFAADDYRLRRRTIEEEAKAAQERRLDEFSLTAASQNVALLRTPSGFALAPMHDGKVVKPDVYQRLPEAMRQDVEARVAALQADLSELLSSAPLLDRETRRRVALLDEETAGFVVHPIVADAVARLADMPAADEFFAALATDVVRNVQLFSAPSEAAVTPQLQRYLAAVVAAGSADARGAPVVVEPEPGPERLLGSASVCRDGAAGITIKPGALHAANNGYLILDARTLTGSSEAWTLLKRALVSAEIVPLAPSPISGGQHIEFEPVPLKTKVVLLADPDTYARLLALDPDMKSLFGVVARLDEDVARDAASEDLLARRMAALVRRHELAPFDASAVNRIVTELSHLSGSPGRMSLDVTRLTGIARESDYWARHRGADVVSREDVETALSERASRDADPAGRNGSGSKP